ncbi:hypothetical protein VU07_04190 [Desulfobulbus sp. F4]|nr:hypothetical protein [Desulfobulbus sp. F4]
MPLFQRMRVQKFARTVERRSFKRKKSRTPSKEEKAEDRNLSKKRIMIEHIFEKLKILRILLEKYRNRRKKGSISGSILLPPAAILRPDYPDN